MTAESVAGAGGMERARGRRRPWVGFLSALGTAAVTLLGLLLVVFLVGRVLPIDPVLSIVGDRAPQQVYDRVFRELHLDRPVLEQFWLFTRDALGGDFGTSLSTGGPIADDLLRFFPATLELATLGILFGVGLGLPIGIACARWRGRWPDSLGRVLSLAGHSMPVFWLGLVLLLMLYAELGWVGGPGRLDIAFEYSVPSVTGMVLVDTLLAGRTDAFLNGLSHLLLPASILGLVALGYISRMTRSFLLWQSRQDYVLVARLKGLSEWAILRRHTLRNAGGPILAVIAWAYASLLEGAVLTETVFALPGLGSYLTQSLFDADMPAVLAATLLIGTLFVLMNGLAEWVQTLLDPRTRPT